MAKLRADKMVRKDPRAFYTLSLTCPSTGLTEETLKVPQTPGQLPASLLLPLSAVSDFFPQVPQSLSVRHLPAVLGHGQAAAAWA